MNTNDNHGFRFRDWQVYKDARVFRKETNNTITDFPPEEKFALTDQARRALNSVILNIAESANKSTDKDMKLYINRAHCSLDEVVACMDCAYDDGYIDGAQVEQALVKAESLAKQLTAFTVYLSKNQSR